MSARWKAYGRVMIPEIQIRSFAVVTTGGDVCIGGFESGQEIVMKDIGSLLKIHDEGLGMHSLKPANSGHYAWWRPALCFPGG